MIEINLVPISLRKKESGGMGILSQVALPKEILIGGGSLFIVVLILAHLLLGIFWAIKSGQQMKYNSEWQKMAPEKSKIDSINQELKELRVKTASITDITSKKSILWSQKFNLLSNAVPKGVWIKKIAWSNNVFNIEGSAVSKLHDEIVIVGNFISNLKKDENFTKDFTSIELGTNNRSKMGSTEIVDFTITAKMK